MIKILSLLILTASILLAGTVQTPTINKLLDYKKDIYLKKYTSKDIKKPVKKAYPKLNIAAKDMYESTKEYNQRVKNSKQTLALKKQKMDKDFTLQLKTYDSKVKKKNNKINQAKDNLPKILTASLGDIVNTYLGKPSIKDFNSYNADDEVYTTSIVSKNLIIPVQIQIPKKIAIKLYKAKELKNIKPIVTFEYSNNSLYISEVKAVYKKQTFNTMPNTPQYDKTFQLNHKLNDIFFTWKNKKISDKDIVNYNKNIKKNEKKKIAKIKKEKVKKEKVEKTNQNELMSLAGVTLGKTTIKEILALGATTSGKFKMRFFRLKGYSFWDYDKTGVITSNYINRSKTMPSEWKKLGYRLDLSYNQWIKLLKSKGYSIRIVDKAKVKNGSLSAVFNATNSNKKIRFTFSNGKNGSKLTDPNTLSSMDIKYRNYVKNNTYTTTTKQKKSNSTSGIQALSKYSIWVHGENSTKEHCNKLTDLGLKVECNAGKYNSTYTYIGLQCPTLPDNTGKLIQQALGNNKLEITDWRNKEGNKKKCSRYDAITVVIGK